MIHPHSRMPTFAKPNQCTLRLAAASMPRPRLCYDPKTDSLYIHLTEKASVDSDEVARGVVLDFDNDGGIVGIDVQHASQHAEIHRLMLHQMPFTDISIAAPPPGLADLTQGRAATPA